jgi:hypothetical protein
MAPRRVFLLIGVLVLLFASNPMYSEQYDIINNYYSDGTFATAVGWEERYCGNSPLDPLDTDGTITAWRDRTFWGCQTHSETVFCQHWNGTYFETADCPDTFNPANRLRYPSY